MMSGFCADLGKFLKKNVLPEPWHNDETLS
jgi:hypothetical protein